MEWLTKLFVRIKNGFYGPASYAEAAEQTVGRGISYAFTIGLIGAMTSVALLIPFIVKVSQTDLTQTVVDKMYPGDLEIVIKDGVASANVPQPYHLPTREVFPPEWNQPEATTDYTEPEFLLSIDTTHPLTLDEVRAMDSFAVLGDRTIFFKKNDAEIRSYELTDVMDLRVNREEARALMEKISPIIRTVLYLIPIAAFIFVLLFSVLGHIVMAVVMAIVVRLVTQMRGWTLKYENAFVVALYAMIPLAILDTLTDLFGLRDSHLLYLALFVGVIVLNFPKKTREISASVPPPPPLDASDASKE